MIDKVVLFSKKIKNFSNKVERCFLSGELENNDILLNKFEEINCLLCDEQPIVSELKLKLVEKNYKLETFLEKIGVLYFLNTVSVSPIELRVFLSTFEQELKKVYVVDVSNNDYVYNGKKIKIENKNDFDFAGKYLDSSIFCNFQLIENYRMDKKNVIIHEIIHLILFETGLQKELERLFDCKKIDELLADVISKNWDEIINIFENGGKIFGS